MNHFKSCPADGIKGEFSATYLYDPNAARRIASFRPKIKIIACVRNPIDRAVSDYKHAIRSGGIGVNMCFEDALKTNQRLLANGLYAKHLEPFFHHFSGQDITVIVSEEVARDPMGVLRSLYRTLGVAEDFIPSSAQKQVHKGIVPRTAWVERVRLKFYRYLVSQGRGDIIEFFKKSGIPEVYRRINGRPERRSYMSPSTRSELAAYFREDVKKLKSLTNLSLSHWDDFQ